MRLELRSYVLRDAERDLLAIAKFLVFVPTAAHRGVLQTAARHVVFNEKAP